MNRFTLIFSNNDPFLCPGCLEELDDRNVVFTYGVAHCKRCEHFPEHGGGGVLAWYVAELIHPRHLLYHRGLVVFNPQVKPTVPVPLLVDTENSYYLRLERFTDGRPDPTKCYLAGPEGPSGN